jgi:hypothetical protein
MGGGFGSENRFARLEFLNIVLFNHNIARKKIP